MTLRIVCPSGHSLKVPEALAGKEGLCPVCKARVKIPLPAAADVSEDAIMGMLDPPASGDSSIGGSEPARKPAVQAPPKKSCFKCNREISAGIHICPHCHTYIAGLRDF